jgi:succinoglycan biosynthesis transport protein ExoP
MTFVQIVRLLVRFGLIISLTAVSLASLVYWVNKDNKQEFQSHTLLNTGLISGYNIESNKGERIDYAFTNNEMENLINMATSLETQKQLSARLLAKIFIELKNGHNPLLTENQEELIISLEGLNLDFITSDSLNLAYELVVDQREANKDNVIYKITNSKNPFFGLDQLEKIMVIREGNSDMIRMEYASMDPFMSQLTLIYLTDIFLKKQKEIKEGQTESVIDYFESATIKSQNRLKKAEDDLLKFRVQNQIINYYEQTRFIAGNKEELDKQYQEQLKIKVGAESALIRVESEIDDKNILPLLQQRIARNKSEMSEYTNQLTEIRLFSDSIMSRETIIKKSDLEVKISTLKNEMSTAAKSLVYVNQTPDGVPTTNLLTQWLNFVIAKEETTAKLKVMKEHQREYKRIYAQFAPLGSTLKRLEREIDVSEREYLENLHSFNEARLHKYNMLMSSNLKVIDQPFFPAQAEQSKAIVMVALAFITGIILPAGGIIGIEMMDSSLKSPKNAIALTGLKLGGLLPKIPKNEKRSPIDFRSIQSQAMNLFIQELSVQKPDQKRIKNVVVFSIQTGEGKTQLINTSKAFIDANFEESEKEFNWIELPSILNQPYGHEHIKNADIHVLVAKADRKWNEVDQHALKVYKKFVGQKPLLFLNGVRADVMEDVIGEVSKKRSWLRRKVKAVLSRNTK